MVNPALAIVVAALKETIDQLLVVGDVALPERSAKLVSLAGQYSCLASVASDIALLNLGVESTDDWQAIADATELPSNSSLSPMMEDGIRQYRQLACLMKEAFTKI